MKLINYKNIVASDELGLYWKGNEHYPAEEISNAKLDLLKNINAYRILIDGAKDERSKYDKIFQDAYELLYQFLYQENFQTYLFKIEDDPHVPTKLRSFRGILPKKKELELNTYFEEEIKVPNNQTLIVSVVHLTKSNFKKVINSIGNNRKGFLVQSPSNNIFNPELLHSIVKDCLRLDFTINYLDLLELVYDKLGCIYRFAGDGGDTFLSIDIFYKNQDLNLISSIEGVVKKNALNFV